MNARPTLAQVIIGFLDLYEKYVEPKRNALANKSKYTYEFLKSYVTYTDPVDDQLNGIVEDLKASGKVARQFDSQYKLIITLREKAELAQSLKVSNGISKLHNTLAFISKYLH